MSFVSANVTTDPTQILDVGIDQINSSLTAAGFPGWSPADADLAVLILTVVAQMAADCANVAATCLPAVFRAFGTMLCGIPYGQGASATVDSLWTFTSPAPTGGYYIEAGTTVIVSGSAFSTADDVTTATNATNATILLVASQSGMAYNGLGGIDAGSPLVQLNQQLDWVASVITLGFTSGGADQQTDSDYEDALSAVLQLQAPRPINAADYAPFLLSDLCLGATGIAVGRATSIDGYYPSPRPLSTGGSGSTALTCGLTSGSPLVTMPIPLLNQVPQVGATVTGTGLPATTVAAGSNGVILPQATINVAATGTLLAAGQVVIGPDTVTYTGVTSTTLTGCTGGTGTLATGEAVMQIASVAASPAPTPSSFALSVSAVTTGSETLTVGEIDGYGPPSLTGTATFLDTATAITLTATEYYGMVPDAAATVTGAGIPSGAVVLASPAPTNTGFSISAATTSAETGETITIGAWDSVGRAVTTFVTDIDGNPLTAESMDVLQTFLDGYREANALPFVMGPSVNTIYVTCTVVVLPNYNAASVVASVTSALLAYLNPATWGNPPGAASTGTTIWYNSTQGFQYVRYNSLIGLVENVQGVQFVPPGGLALGTSASPAGTSDILLTGPAPLVYSDDTTPTIIVNSVPLSSVLL